MRTLSDTLKAAQQAGALNPLYKIVLTKQGSSYTYEKDRILPSEHDEEMYSHRAKIVLHNRDHALDDIDLRGYDAVISYGFADEYSATASLSVMDQQFDSDPNNLSCTLFLEGIPNSMAEDEASESYLPEEDNEDTVKTLIDAIAGATLAPFTHCHAYEVVWDTGYDSLADTYKPKDNLRIYKNSSRLSAFRKVLDYTANVPRFEDDGKIHIMKHVTSGTDCDSEYSLDKGAHQFFSKAYRNTLIRPNRFVVESQPDDDPQYSGEAAIDGYDDLPSKAKKTKFFQTRLESNAQAQDIAEALISKAEMGSARGQAEIRINVGAEVFDYVKVTDSRQGDTRTGNLGYIHRRFGGDKWMMTFGFGNWFDALRYQKLLKELETYTDAGQYFSRLQVGDLYAEHILADNMDFVWIDPDNTIDLSKIGDTFDNLPEGESYYRARKMNLNGETGLTLWEGMKYYIRFSPDSDEAGIRRQDTAPTGVDVGEYWIDTSGAEPIIKRWTGSAWFTIEQAEIDALNKGLLTSHTKLASLSPDGLVLLDKVQIGDDYGLVKKTAISAGKIILTGGAGVDGSLPTANSDAKCTDPDADQTSAHPQSYYWITGSKPPINADHTASIVGEMAYEDMVEKAKLGTTIVEGGYIKSSLITADNILVGTLSGNRIYGGTITGTIFSQAGGKVVLDSSGITIKGEEIYFKTSGGLPRGSIYGDVGGLMIGSTKGIFLIAHDGNIGLTPLSGHGIDMSSGQFLNLPAKSSNPSNFGGRLYYDTTKNLICYYRSGVGWRVLQDNAY